VLENDGRIQSSSVDDGRGFGFGIIGEGTNLTTPLSYSRCERTTWFSCVSVCVCVCVCTAVVMKYGRGFGHPRTVFHTVSP